ncbi:hypothetical protein FDUTEX481_10029 [Tolypothrix sp. PCC 7601]|nr:hypothetical protein FDUTEX481_10029 [Tolypothrix sp. PCC 7601]
MQLLILQQLATKKISDCCLSSPNEKNFTARHKTLKGFLLSNATGAIAGKPIQCSGFSALALSS